MGDNRKGRRPGATGHGEPCGVYLTLTSYDAETLDEMRIIFPYEDADKAEAREAGLELPAKPPSHVKIADLLGLTPFQVSWHRRRRCTCADLIPVPVAS